MELVPLSNSVLSTTDQTEALNDFTAWPNVCGHPNEAQSSGFRRSNRNKPS